MALDFTSYDGLVTSIGETLNRNDLADSIPGWIALAEERHKTDIRINEMQTRTAPEITGRTLAFPTGFLELKRMRVAATAAGYPYMLDQVGSDELTRYYRSTASDAPAARRPPWDRPINMPRYFSADGLFEFDVDPSEYTSMDEPFAQILYWKSVTPLSAGNPSNAILVRAPAAYFYGALIHSAPYLLDDERVALWGAGYQASVSAINANDRKRAGPLASRVAGSTP